MPEAAASGTRHGLVRRLQSRRSQAFSPGDLALLWRNSIRYATALAIAAFPFVFFLDEAATLPFSPVLPGLLGLVLIMVFLPLAVVEVRVRRLKDAEAARAGILRSVQGSWACMGVAIVWLLVWFSWGL